MEAPQWFFAWTKGKPYVTSICSWTRRDLIREVEKQMGDAWRKTYRNGGRAIKCKVTPNLTKANKTVPQNAA